jgi:hypothetical protein
MQNLSLAWTPHVFEICINVCGPQAGPKGIVWLFCGLKLARPLVCTCSIPSPSHSFITYRLFKFACLVSLFLGSITRSLNVKSWGGVKPPSSWSKVPFVTRYSVPYNFAFGLPRGFLETFCMHCLSDSPFIFLPPSYVFLSALYFQTPAICAVTRKEDGPLCPYEIVQARYVFFDCSLTLRYTFIINYGMPACLPACQAGTVHLQSGGRDSVFCIATWYGLDGPRSNSGEGEIFRARPNRPRCPHWDRSGGKAAGAWCWPSIPFQCPGYEWVGAIPPPPVFACLSTSWGWHYLYRH